MSRYPSHWGPKHIAGHERGVAEGFPSALEADRVYNPERYRTPKPDGGQGSLRAAEAAGVYAAVEAAMQKMDEERAYVKLVAQFVERDRSLWGRFTRMMSTSTANFGMGATYTFAGVATGVDLFSVPAAIHLGLGVVAQIRGVHRVRSKGVPRRPRALVLAQWVAEHHPRVRRARRASAAQLIRASQGREGARVRLEAVESAEAERAAQRKAQREGKRKARIEALLSWEREALEADGGDILEPSKAGPLGRQFMNEWTDRYGTARDRKRRDAQWKADMYAEQGRVICVCDRFDTGHEWVDHAKGER